ncbi:MAG: O-antigen ligase [Vicingaceae bacterium]|jgi:O-antigen ligase
MSFTNWRKWFKRLPLSIKWFILLLLIRPVLDQFYFLKEISPLISPLYLVGILTPFFIFISFGVRSFPKRIKSIKSDLLFVMWSLLLFANLIAVFLIDSPMDSLATLLRFSLPVLLYLYFRSVVNSRLNLIGILQTLYYSAYFPALLLGYEFIFGSLNAEYLSDSRGGGERMQGGYADIMNYAIYISSALIIKAYFFFRSKKSYFKRKNFRGLMLTVIVSFLGLIAIKQTISWLVFIYLISLFMVFNFKSAKGKLIVIILAPLFIFIGLSVFESKIEPLIEKEYAVIEGEKEIGRAFNGRASRWIYYFDVYSTMPVVSNVFGTPLSLEQDAKPMISGLMHNEYIRLLFLTGIAGLALFLLFLFGLFRKVWLMDRADRFLGLAVLGSFAIFSVTTTPLIYAPYLYFVIPVFAYMALPSIILKSNNG